MKLNGVWLICSAVVAVGVLSSCRSAGAALPALVAAGCKEERGTVSCPNFTYLRGANLSGANLTDAYMYQVNLTDANLTGMTWSNTTCPDGTVTNTGC
jgi:uncharacterized protein YjbI with pentapeptide repeats